MCQEKQTTTGTTNQTMTPTPTAEETALNKLTLERMQATQPGMIQAQQQGLGLINQLLTGQQLPGYLGTLPGGLSSEAIGHQASRMAGQYGAGFQNLGIADSGVAYRETARGIANELLMPSEQFNLQNLMQLLNIGVGGQAQVQQPILAQSGQLGASLAGLRSVTQTGTTSQTTTSMNPFLKSFQTSLGQTFGSPKFGLPFGGSTIGFGG